MNYFKLFIITIALSILASCSQEPIDGFPICGTVTDLQFNGDLPRPAYYLYLNYQRIEVSQEKFLSALVGDEICLDRDDV